MAIQVMLAGALAALLAPPGITAQDAASKLKVDDEGTFVLTFAGRDYGMEKFSIRSRSDRVEAEAEIHLQANQTGQPVSYEMSPKLVLDSNLDPQTYAWQQKGSEVYQLQVDFRVSPAKSELLRPSGQKDVRDFTLQKDVVILDDNVVHHYQLLADRYARTPGGKQTFQAYIPQEAVPGILTVQDAGPDTANVGGHEKPLRHLVVTAETSQIDLWVDAEGRLQRVRNASAQLEAERKP